MQEPNVKINCHSSICIDDNIFIDPFNVNEKKFAKIIFITHSHYDHLDLKSIKNLLNEETVIVCTKDSERIIKQSGIKNKIIIISPNEKGNIGDIQFETFPAYNIGHHHFKENGFVGYTIIKDKLRYTICGDTDVTPELKKIKTDVLLVPIGGTYTMDVKEGANLTNIIKPKFVIPTHYNFIEGTAGKEVENLFAKLVDKDVKVLIKIK